MASRIVLVSLVIYSSDAAARDVSFRNEVMAVLAKAGCSAGTCHGNKNGKGGFKLSLRGEDPPADWVSLTREMLGRRVDLTNPDQSLILLKPTTQMAHEGGKRFAKGSMEYEMIRQWIAEGLGNDLETAPKLERLEVTPRERILIEPESSVQLNVKARFSDGRERDVTSLTVFEVSNGVARVSGDGVVQRMAWGESTVLARYLHLQEPVRIAFVPARPGFRWSEPGENNYIDRHIFAKLQRLRMNPSDLCTDLVFVRRAYLDLLGLLPTPAEGRVFAADPSPNKRAVLIERLLDRPEFSDFWALKWADLLRTEAHSLDQKGVHNFHAWIRRSIAEHKPLDQFARELISARGSTYSQPAANYYRPNRDPASRAKAAAQVFLGIRLQCAECHNHPFDRWTQDDYYDWAGLFAQVDYKVLRNDREIGSDRHEWKGEQVIFISRRASLQNPRTGQPAQPRFLGESDACATDDDYLARLADWLTRSGNPFFARAQANRIWYHLMGRGLVEPLDDFRATNPPSHPELLDALAADLAQHQFDLRHLIRTIMNSRTYQLSSEPNDTNREDDLNFSHVWVRRLTAEQVLDCQSQATGVPLTFNGYPPGTRAAQLPGVRPESKGKRRSNQLDQFLEIFGKPPRLMTSETERSCECNMGQALQLISGSTVNEFLVAPKNRITHLLDSGLSNQKIVEELYWMALTQAPSALELERLTAFVGRAADRRAELEDILWGLLNSKEFVFRK